jgi:putative heme-binding domain-containing protein
VGEQQSALGALGGIKTPEAVAALGRLLDGLAAGTTAPAIQLDLLEAVQTSGAAPLAARLEQIGVGRALENLAKVFPAALINGGNANRGRQVVTQHPAAQCTRCHVVGAGVSTVGPSLNGIGTRLSREELLQSLIDPSAKIAPGFGQVTVTLMNGQKVEGTLRAETATTLSIEDPTSGLREIAKSDVASGSNAVSAMPPMGLLLKPREIRDVVEAMAQQR